jgi:hypothetical protein
VLASSSHLGKEMFPSHITLMHPVFYLTVGMLPTERSEMCEQTNITHNKEERKTLVRNIPFQQFQTRKKNYKESQPVWTRFNGINVI